MANDLSRDDRDRISGREWAEEILDELEGLGIGPSHSEAFREGFWREIRRRVKAEAKKERARKVMSDERSRAFGRRTVDFGRHRGERYDDVPLDYLEWLADQGAELQAYLESRRLKTERGQ